MKSKAIKKALLTGSSEELERRRKIIALSALGLVDFSIISLYQTGVIKKLPDLPYAIFDSNKVNASPDAYQMGAPDGTISTLVYASAMVLASVEGSRESGRKPIFDMLLGATVFGNAAGAAYYLYNMAFKQKKICLYCLAGAAINFSSAAIIAPLVLKSIKELFRRK